MPMTEVEPTYSGNRFLFRCATCDNCISEYRAAKFPICDDCLKVLAQVIKEKRGK